MLDGGSGEHRRRDGWELGQQVAIRVCGEGKGLQSERHLVRSLEGHGSQVLGIQQPVVLDIYQEARRAEEV